MGTITITDWVIATAAVVALVLSYLNYYKNFGAKVDFDFSIMLPDCHMTKVDDKRPEAPVGSKVKKMFYRIRVRSCNRVEPQNLELNLVAKTIKVGDAFQVDSGFSPMPLNWSFQRFLCGGNPVAVLGRIPVGVSKFCDFSSIVEPGYQAQEFRDYLAVRPGDILMGLETVVWTRNNSHVLTKGVYRFEIMLAGSNFRPVRKFFELRFNDKWSEEVGEMLNEAVSVREVKNLGV